MRLAPVLLLAVFLLNACRAMPEDSADGAVTSSSASLAAMSLEELAREAELIVVGSTKRIGTFPNGGGPLAAGKAGSRPIDHYRDVVIGVEDVVKGQVPGAELTVRLHDFGGEADFAPDERFLVFLASYRRPGTGEQVAGSYRVAGAGQGKYTIADGGQATRSDWRAFGTGFVPLVDLLRFVRSAATQAPRSSAPKEAPLTPTAIPPFPANRPAVVLRPTQAIVSRDSNFRLLLGSSALRFPELTEVIGQLLAGPVQRSNLDVPPAMLDRARREGAAAELVFPAGTVLHLDGRSMPIVRLLIPTSWYLSQDALVYVDGGTGYEPSPLRATDRSALQRLRQLLREVTYIEVNDGVVTAVERSGQGLAIMSKEHGPIRAVLDERSEVYGPAQGQRATGKAELARNGQAVTLTGWPDPHQEGVVHVQYVILRDATGGE